MEQYTCGNDCQEAPKQDEMTQLKKKVESLGERSNQEENVMDRERWKI